MPNPEQKEEAPKPLRTYQSDVEEILKEGSGSLAKIAIAENDRKIRGGFTLEEVEAPSHTRLIVWTSVSLIVAGILALSALYLFRNTHQPTVAVSGPKPIILADTEKNLDIAGFNREKIINALVAERDRNIASLASVVALKLNKGKGEQAQPVSAEEFFSKLESHAPSELTRSLEGNFMFGIHVLSKNQPFIVLKTSYYQNAFAGMLAWEKNLKEDLGPIFIPPEPLTPTSTSDQVLGKNMSFEDAVVKNRDVRALRGKTGAIVFLYSFQDKNTIIITTNADTLEKVIARLLAGKLVQ